MRDPGKRGVAISETIRHALDIFRAECIALENVRPRLVEHADYLQLELASLNLTLEEVDERLVIRMPKL